MYRRGDTVKIKAARKETGRPWLKYRSVSYTQQRIRCRNEHAYDEQCRRIISNIFHCIPSCDISFVICFMAIRRRAVHFVPGI